MGTTGFNEDSGSWKIIARSRPRRSLMPSSGNDSRSVPSKSTRPVIVVPRLGSSRMIASDVTDLPQPDSPTSPTVCPGATSKLTLSTAVNGATPFRLNCTVRSSTWSNAVIGSPPVLRVDGLAQRFPEQGEPQHHDDDRAGRPERQLRMGVDTGLSLTEHLAPLGERDVLRSEAKERQRGGVENGGRHHQGGLNDHRGNRVRHHVSE